MRAVARSVLGNRTLLLGLVLVCGVVAMIITGAISTVFMPSRGISIGALSHALGVVAG